MSFLFFTGGEVTIFFRLHNAKLNVRHNYKASMIIFKHAKGLENFIQRNQAYKNSVGFVPTMGALHEGHLSLLRECKKTSKLTVASIFVNPTQFNNAEDLKKYPRPVSEDILLLEENGCDILFLPDEKEIYPDEESKKKSFSLGIYRDNPGREIPPGPFPGSKPRSRKTFKYCKSGFSFFRPERLSTMPYHQKINRIDESKNRGNYLPHLSRKKWPCHEQQKFKVKFF